MHIVSLGSVIHHVLFRRSSDRDKRRKRRVLSRVMNWYFPRQISWGSKYHLLQNCELRHNEVSFPPILAASSHHTWYVIPSDHLLWWVFSPWENSLHITLATNRPLSTLVFLTVVWKFNTVMICVIVFQEIIISLV